MTTLKFTTKAAVILCLAVALTACGGKKRGGGGIDENLTQQHVESLYNNGKKSLDRGNYQFAIQFYRALEAAYPYGPYTEQAKLDMIYALSLIHI